MKIGICGHFGGDKLFLDGQTIKTKEIACELQKQFSEECIIKTDSYKAKKRMVFHLLEFIKCIKSTDQSIILPAQNSLIIYSLLFGTVLKSSGHKVHYVVIGGWLPQIIKKRVWIKDVISGFKGIYVETNTMKSALEMQGFENVYVMPNCKRLAALSTNELVYPSGLPYKLCTFSRVIKEKGIETAINIIKQVNERLGYIAYSLDIYGQVDIVQEEWFGSLKKQFPNYIRYCGCVDANHSVEVLKEYFLLLFPTHFYTEGIPGTIIDAYAAGVPVLSAKWENYSDVVDEGVTGVGYDFDDVDQLERVLLEIAQNPKGLLDMKENCIRKAKDYTPEAVIKTLIERF